MIGVAAAFGLYLAAAENQGKPNFTSSLKEASEKLLATRPTAVNLHSAVERLMQAIDGITHEHNITNTLLAEAEKLRAEEIDNCYQIGLHGLRIIEKIS